GMRGESGCVSWMFEKKGLITILQKDCEEDRLMELALEAGAEDVTTEDDAYEIVTSPLVFDAVNEALDANRIPIASAEVTTIPKTTVRVEGRQAEQVLKLMEMLEDLDDIQQVYSNFDIDEAMIEG
ncbi:MAG: YebC/PmpR family DNA-binding transcriptional regulator, partial [bacterium]